MFKKTFLLLSASLIILSGCNPTATISSGGNLTAISPLTYNWGDINIMGGDVEQMFLFKNDDDSDLELKGALTSCMCTKAKFILSDGSTSPYFSMHDVPGSWTHKVKPGEEFKVEVEFDPLAHGPDAVGPISRTVELFNSDEETTIKLLGNVLNEEEFKEQDASAELTMGDFIFEEAEYDFGVIKQSGGIVKHDFKFKYVGDEPVKIVGTPGSCLCTSASISSDLLNPEDEGFLTVEFDPNIHEEPEGKFFKTVTILTEPQQEENVDIKIWAEIDLDLGPEAFKLKEEHVD